MQMTTNLTGPARRKTEERRIRPNDAPPREPDEIAFYDALATKNSAVQAELLCAEWV